MSQDRVALRRSGGKPVPAAEDLSTRLSTRVPLRLRATNQIHLHGEGAGAGDEQPGTAVPVAEPVAKTRLCPMYKVFLHNDPITRFQFVVEILRRVFNVANKQAQNVTNEAHERGLAFVTALPLEQAEFRVQQAHSLARSAGYPLTFTYEPE